MFTGIIEELGEVVELKKEKDNLHITVKSNLSSELKVDQSLSHDGVCLTVVALGPGTHTITAIDETLEKSNLGRLSVGSRVNLERATRIGSRLDGHIVQGHVDQIGICTRVEELEGSWMYTFEYDPAYDNITIEKGSITVNGVSLTVVNSKEKSFSVAIIPYTFEHTNFHAIRVNDTVNLEFDVIGKYVARLLSKEEA
jgi:riboflavin synthase